MAMHLPTQLGMLQQISPKLLSFISREISSGNTLWGLLWANEYLEASDPLRKALVSRALPRLARSGTSGDLIDLVISGAPLSRIPLLSNKLTSSRKANPKKHLIEEPALVKRRIQRNSLSRRSRTIGPAVRYSKREGNCWLRRNLDSNKGYKFRTNMLVHTAHLFHMES